MWILYDRHAPTNEFLVYFSSRMFLPVRVTSNSKLLIDNIFSSILGPDSVSVNLNATVFDHRPQYAISSNISLTHRQVVSEIFMKEIGLTLTNKILFLTIQQKTRVVLLKRNTQA